MKQLLIEYESIRVALEELFPDLPRFRRSFIGKILKIGLREGEEFLPMNCRDAISEIEGQIRRLPELVKSMEDELLEGKPWLDKIKEVLHQFTERRCKTTWCEVYYNNIEGFYVRASLDNINFFKVGVTQEGYEAIVEWLRTA